MKTKNRVISAVIAMTQSQWMRPVLMTLAIFAAVLVVTGCDRSGDSDHRDSDHHMNHGNQNHSSGGNN